MAAERKGSSSASTASAIEQGSAQASQLDQSGAPTTPAVEIDKAPQAPAGEPIYVVAPGVAVSTPYGTVESGQHITPSHVSGQAWFDELVERGTIVRRS